MKKIISVLIICCCHLSGFPQEKIISEEDVILSYPFTVNYFSLIVQKEKLVMAYMDVKPKNSNGKTIVLLHGKNFCGAYWETTANRLSAEGYRIIIPDQIGFGKSSLPQNIQYSFFQLARNTKALLDSLEIKSAIIIGHSMGGMLAARLALMFPDYFEKVILEDPIGLRDFDKNKSHVSVDDLYKRELTQDYEKIKQYHQKTYYHNEWKNAYEKWVKMMSVRFAGTDKELFAWNSAKIYDMIYTQPIVYELPGISIPVLYIAGDMDPMVPPIDSLTSMLNRRGKGKTYFQVYALEGIGHIPHIEAFDIFIGKVEEFLTE